jgi:hypothetical protein
MTRQTRKRIKATLMIIALVVVVTGGFCLAAELDHMAAAIG